ncbi:MAG: SUMF1/EgtB/PvdO family nonheme iron enzyme, partial [Planctomycetota bacterium]
HDGPNLLEVITMAMACEPPSYPPHVPDGLRAICDRALARAPEDRYESAADFGVALRAYVAHRQSLAIARQAEQLLVQCQTDSKKFATEQVPRDDRNRLYDRYAEAVAGFRQAGTLCPDATEAFEGERAAREAYARAALAAGDLGLAASQAARVESDVGRELRARVEAARREREKAQRARAITRRSLVGLACVIVIGLATSVFLISQARRAEVRERRIATERLESILRLSDGVRLQEVEADADSLWPASHRMIEPLTAWRERAVELLGHLPRHEKSLIDLRAEGVFDEGAFVFPTPEAQWEHDTLKGLVDRLRTFRDKLVPQVDARLAIARSIRERTIGGAEGRAAWAEAVAAIADPKGPYKGLTLAPIEGLLPLGPDPGSGLWEFGHVLSGALPKRDAKGRLVRDPGMCVVLVLIPGGAFRIGAVPPRSASAAFHEDPDAGPDESAGGRLPEVVLDPFLIGKYEMTQGQWERLSGANPSRYPAGEVFDEHTHTALHPVEQVSWTDADALLSRYDLGLPTEAQWETAARAGTKTPWPTGVHVDSLQGASNIADLYCKENGGRKTWTYTESLNDGYALHAPVGTFRPNRFGLHDTIGNVWEWCRDWYGPYVLPMKEGTGERVVPLEAREHRAERGGSFNFSAYNARSACRYRFPPEYRDDVLGVRAARRIGE